MGRGIWHLLAYAVGTAGLIVAGCAGLPEADTVTQGQSKVIQAQGQITYEPRSSFQLLDAAETGDLARVQALIAESANVNANFGVTALIQAAQNGHAEVVQALIAAKADVDAKANNGTTALIVASQNGYMEAVSALIAAKADVNAKATNGRTALMQASQNGYGEVVRALITAGADPNASDNHGNRAVDLATAHGHSILAQFLRSGGRPFPDIFVQIGTGQYLFSGDVQNYLMIKMRSAYKASRHVLIIQEPHFNAKQQWYLFRGMELFFRDNPGLVSKTAFLAEGVKARRRLDLSPLVGAEAAPSDSHIRTVLSSFLIPGYVAYEWRHQHGIPIIGTEDRDLYNLSSQLWEAKDLDSWSWTVAARNGTMADVLLETIERYDNPILFVGGAHLFTIDTASYQKSTKNYQKQVNQESSISPENYRNVGIAEILANRRVGFTYITALDAEDRFAQESEGLYRELFRAQTNGSYEEYIRHFLERSVPQGSVTTTPSPEGAAKLVKTLSKKTDSGEKNTSKQGRAKKGDGKKGGGNGGGIRTTIGRYEDALSRLDLRGKNLKSGRRAIRDADPNLTESRTDAGSHKWEDKNGRVRVRYDPKGKHLDAQWDKFAPDGTRIDNAGRPGLEHIPVN